MREQMCQLSYDNRPSFRLYTGKVPSKIQNVGPIAFQVFSE
jgi:hypothetical protein